MEQPEQPQSNFVIQKIYTKDISFESPSSPEAFKLNWNPQANVELNMNNKKLDDDIYEIGNKTIFHAGMAIGDVLKAYFLKRLIPKSQIGTGKILCWKNE